jgi:hypothetical protein
MEKDKKKTKVRIAIFITAGIFIIAGAVLLFMLLGDKEEEGPMVHEIPVQRIGTEEGASLDMPYEYIRSIMNRQDNLLKNAKDIEAQTFIAKRPDDIALAYSEPWNMSRDEKIFYLQGVTSVRTIERKGNCTVTFIEGYDSSYLMQKNEGAVEGYAILPEWMKDNIAPGYKVDNITILLINKEPRPVFKEFKVIGFYKIDTEDIDQENPDTEIIEPEDTIYASMYSYVELFTEYEEEVLDSLITSLSIYYEDGADMSSIYSFMNDYFSDSQTKKEGENWVYMDYDFFYIPVTEQ